MQTTNAVVSWVCRRVLVVLNNNRSPGDVMQRVHGPETGNLESDETRVLRGSGRVLAGVCSRCHLPARSMAGTGMRTTTDVGGVSPWPCVGLCQCTSLSQQEAGASPAVG